jgi:two-component system LytT family response regulator
MESVKSITEKKIFVERIVVKEQGRILYLPVKEIQWIESAANYLSLYSGQGTFTLRETLTNIEKKLDPEIFRRIHRSVIVRLTEIREVKQWLNEDYIIILKNGTQLSVGRSYKKEVLKRLRSGDI